MPDRPQPHTHRQDPRMGATVEGRYRILSWLGGGGMGDVYLAEHLRLKRKFALKIMRPDQKLSDVMVARFQREAMAAASIGHPHIVDVTDMGQFDETSSFLVLEYLEGADLAAVVDAQGPLSPARAVHIALQLCDALSAVHAQHIVHRDLKPENVMLIERHGDPDFVKVLDFGICKLLSAEGDDPSQHPRLTRTDAALGTPHYMAPEQFEGSAAVDHRADIYAVGATLYFALTGRELFHADNLPMLCMHVCSTPVPSVRATRPELPHELDAVLARACAKDKQDRFESCLQMAEALMALGIGEGPRHSFVARRANEHPEEVVIPPAPALPKETVPSPDWDGATESAGAPDRPSPLTSGTTDTVKLQRAAGWRVPPFFAWVLGIAAGCVVLLWVAARWGNSNNGAHQNRATDRIEKAAAPSDAPVDVRATPEEAIAQPRKPLEAASRGREDRPPQPSSVANTRDRADPATTSSSAKPPARPPRSVGAPGRAPSTTQDHEAAPGTPEPVITAPTPEEEPVDTLAPYRHPVRELRPVF